MIKVDLETDSLKDSLGSHTPSIKKKIKRELKDEVSSSLDIKRPWALKGFRSPTEPESKNLLKKFEDGKEGYSIFG